MPIDIEVFLSSPHLATNIDTLKKEDLISLAKHFEITINSQMKKNEIKKSCCSQTGREWSYTKIRH